MKITIFGYGKDAKVKLAEDGMEYHFTTAEAKAFLNRLHDKQEAKAEAARLECVEHRKENGAPTVKNLGWYLFNRFIELEKERSNTNDQLKKLNEVASIDASD